MCLYHCDGCGKSGVLGKCCECEYGKESWVDRVKTENPPDCFGFMNKCMGSKELPPEEDYDDADILKQERIMLARIKARSKLFF